MSPEARILLLEAGIKRLEDRLEAETERADYFQAELEKLNHVLREVELLDCSNVIIENNGSDSYPWEINIASLDEERVWKNRRGYFGATLKAALQQMSAGEAKRLQEVKS